MKLTVLGKYGPYPKKGDGATSCYLVEDKETSIILDMGAGTLSRILKKIEVEKIDAIFLSHIHFDHTSDLLPFRYLLDDIGIPITIYTHYVDSEWYRILLTHPKFNVVNIDETSKIKLKDLELSFYKMTHPVPNYAIKIAGTKTLVYTGDTVYNDNILIACKDTDLLLADCCKPQNFAGPHMTVDDAIVIHKKTGVKILATHLNPDYSPEQFFMPYPEISVAKEGMTYTI